MKRYIVYLFSIFLIMLLLFGSYESTSARYSLSVEDSFSLKSKPSNVSTSVNNSELILGSPSASVSTTIKVINNNDYDIRFNVILSDDMFSLNYNNSEQTLKANSEVSVPVIVSSKDGVWYTKASDNINVSIFVTSPYKLDEINHEIVVKTYGYELIKLMQKDTPTKSNPNFQENVTTESSSGLYSMNDNDGKSIYYRGVVNNHVSFANKSWRIIRRNGNGSYRFILDGYIGRSYFSSSGASTGKSAIVYNNSSVKSAVENWYASNMSSFDNYIDRGSYFLQDTSVNSYSSSAGNTFNAWIRVTSGSPSLQTGVNADMYTTNDASRGNKYLKYPVGLITSDEVMLAGGTFSENTFHKNEQYYLYVDLGSDKVYGIWTMSPRRYFDSGGGTSLMIVSKPQASLYFEPPGVAERSVRPVINFKSSYQMKGTGTSDDPYFVSEIQY